MRALKGAGFAHGELMSLERPPPLHGDLWASSATDDLVLLSDAGPMTIAEAELDMHEASALFGIIPNKFGLDLTIINY